MLEYRAIGPQHLCRSIEYSDIAVCGMQAADAHGFHRALSLERLLAEARIASKHDRPRAVVHFELGEDTGDVVTHRLHAQAELRSDLSIVAALCDQLDQLELARRERGKRRVVDRMRGQETPQFVEPA